MSETNEGGAFAGIVDAQIHLFEADSPQHPWDADVLRDDRAAAMRGRFGAHSASPTEVIEMMDAHGVSGALVVASGIYGYDNSYSRYAYEVAPDRYRVVAVVDPVREDVAEVVEKFAADPAYVGLRLILESDESVVKYRAGGDDRLLAAAQRSGMPMCVLSPGRFDVFEDIARRFSELPVVIDHLGLFSVSMLDPAVTDTFGLVNGLLPLASYENVTVKVTSLPMLSRKPYPFPDVWPHLHAVIDAFGVDRLMWGSDAIVFDHPYSHMIDFLRESDELSRSEKEALLGATLRAVWGWPRNAASS
jgi:L-fuconolactonase